MTPRFSAHPCVLRFERLHVAVTTGITGQTVLFSVIIIATTGPDAARNHYLLVPVVLELVERAIVPTFKQEKKFLSKVPFSILFQEKIITVKHEEKKQSYKSIFFFRCLLLSMFFFASVYRLSIRMYYLKISYKLKTFDILIQEGTNYLFWMKLPHEWLKKIFLLCVALKSWLLACLKQVSIIA